MKRNAQDQHIIAPPTYFKVNDVTYVFQEITNTYGVPMYQEANPSVFSTVTFPFLFAVMFGDYGHGSLILFVGTCLVLGGNRMKGGAMDGAAKLRYLFFMMGMFSCFTGLLYNEWFAIPNDWFGSCFATSERVCLSNSTSCDPTYLPG